jgi:hypothetical protein
MQLAEFLGLAPAKISLHLTTTAAQNLKRMASKVGMVLTPKSAAKLTSREDSEDMAQCGLWISSRIDLLCRKLCWELTFSVDPFELIKTIGKVKHQDPKLCSLFCFSAWMAPVIPDYADIGAYSMATKARIYRKAAERMPKLILEASFGEHASLRTMQVRPAHNVGRPIVAFSTKTSQQQSCRVLLAVVHRAVGERRGDPQRR